jgi:hypothetical protein
MFLSNLFPIDSKGLLFPYGCRRRKGAKRIITIGCSLNTHERVLISIIGNNQLVAIA